MIKIGRQHRRAIRDLADGGLLFTIVDSGVLCRRAPPVGTGYVVYDGPPVRISPGVVGMIDRRFGLVPAPGEPGARMLPAEDREVARMIGEGRDVLDIWRKRRPWPPAKGRLATSMVDARPEDFNSIKGQMTDA